MTPPYKVKGRVLCAHLLSVFHRVETARESCIVVNSVGEHLAVNSTEIDTKQPTALSDSMTRKE